MGKREQRFRAASAAAAPGRRICHESGCHEAPGHDDFAHGLTPAVSNRAARRKRKGYGGTVLHNTRTSTRLDPDARRKL